MNFSRRDFLRVSAMSAGAAAFGAPQSLRASTARPVNSPRIALVGCGGQGRADISTLLGCGVNLVAMCDPDPGMIVKTRETVGEAGKAAKEYDDYRRLLDDASSYDAVLIATPDHWHAPLATTFIKANKHVYCEKPLTRTIAESRALRELARKSRVVTQMGNQGSASPSMRRCIEIIRAGALGQVRDIHLWGLGDGELGYGGREGSAQGEDPIPDGFNWDMWVGPSEMRPYKAEVYHPLRWRDWLDFGEGTLGDFGCHSLDLPVHALDLDYPAQIVLNRTDGESQPAAAPVEYRFAARDNLAPLTFHWWAGNKMPPEIMQPILDVYPARVYGDSKQRAGIMIMGEQGCIFTTWWNTECLIRLDGEPKLLDVLHHPPTETIPITIPRVKNHYEEWVEACLGNGVTFSDFETGGRLNEISLAGVVALRTGKSLEWDGENMRATNAPEASRFVRCDYRSKWLV